MCLLGLVVLVDCQLRVNGEEGDTLKKEKRPPREGTLDKTAQRSVLGKLVTFEDSKLFPHVRSDIMMTRCTQDYKPVTWPRYETIFS